MLLSKVFRKLGATRPAEFCDTCAQVCTAQCRSEALYERTRVQAVYHLPVIR